MVTVFASWEAAKSGYFIERYWFDFPQFVVSGWLLSVLTAVLTVPFISGLIRHRVLRRRAAQNRCLRCGYLLTGNVSGRCPECGSEIAARRAAATPAGSRHR
jgi:uncharacterized paraquat-inducible protein A